MSPAIDQLTQEVSNATTVDASAKALIDGFQQRLLDAVNAALENGATAEQLVPLTDLGTSLQVGSDALAASVAANTQPPPGP